MSGFLLPVQQTEEDSGVGTDTLLKALAAVSFLLPLFTRQHAAKVFADMSRKAASKKASVQDVLRFVKNKPEIKRNLLETAYLGLARAPEFNKIGYEGYLAGLGPLGGYGAAFMPGRKPVIAISSKANPFVIGHELAHFLTVPTRHRPSWVGPYVDPVLLSLEDPAVKLEMLNKLYSAGGKLGYIPPRWYAEHLVSPEEVLANAVASRIMPRSRREFEWDFATGSVLPKEYWPVADMLAKFLEAGIRP